MQAGNFVLQKYFDRIGYRGNADADITTLSQMMRCQLFTVPFENLDVQAGKVISLVPEEIVEKIVAKNRGGYCYEINGLFAMALESLGIPYQFVAARPMFYPVKRPKTHMAVVVELGDEKWLCDLGFGSYGIRAPMRLSVLDTPITQDHDTFMLCKTSERDFLVKALVEGEWANQYGFDLSPQEWIDFVPANYLNSTHPDAVFVQKLVIVLHDQTGRNILVGNALKTVVNGKVEKRLVDAKDIPTVLRNTFGLVQ